MVGSYYSNSFVTGHCCNFVYIILCFYSGYALIQKYLYIICCWFTQEVVGWYKLRRNSSMQVSMREHAVHTHLSHWLESNGFSHAVLLMLCVSQSATNTALYTCDHQYLIASDV